MGGYVRCRCWVWVLGTGSGCVRWEYGCWVWVVCVRYRIWVWVLDEAVMYRCTLCFRRCESPSSYIYIYIC